MEQQVEVAARSAETVFTRFLNNETRMRARFQIDDSDRENLRDLLKSWAMARRA
jgi:hypothetical protein